MEDATNVIYLGASDAEGHAIGKCLKFTAAGKQNVVPCPRVARDMLGEPKKKVSVRYFSEILRVHAGGSTPGFSASTAIDYIAEVKLERAVEAVWKSPTDDQLVSLSHVCSGGSHKPFDAIIVEEYDGCGRVEERQSADAGGTLWTVEVLHAAGDTRGTPKNFAYQAGNDGAAQGTPQCDGPLAAIRVRIEDWEGWCARIYQTPRAERAERRARELEAEVRRTKAEVNAEIAARLETQASLNAAKEHLRAQEALNEKQKREIEHRVSALESAGSELTFAKTQLRTTEAALEAERRKNHAHRALNEAQQQRIAKLEQEIHARKAEVTKATEAYDSASQAVTAAVEGAHQVLDRRKNRQGRESARDALERVESSVRQAATAEVASALDPTAAGQ